MDHLVSQLNERQILLVLDNFVHAVTGYLSGLFGEPGSVPAAWPGPDVHPLALRAEQDQQLNGFGPGRAEPVRHARVELGGFARLHDEVVLGEPQP